MKKIFILLLFTTFISCKTVFVNKQSQKIASSALELVTIGKTLPNLQINTFEITSIPQLNHKLRVSVSVLPFNKSTFRAYSKAVKSQGRENTITYTDSLDNKAMFVSLKLIDKVTLINELNSTHNLDVFNYLKAAPAAAIISTISVVFDGDLLNEIRQAEELYLSNVKYKKYDLELYKNKKLYKTIEFTKGTIFTYKLASFCWGRNTKHQTILLNIIEENSNCTGNTFDSYNEANEIKQSIKF